MASTALFVLGMHRSGTSALAGVCQMLGAAMGQRLMPAARDNEKGFFEQEDVVTAHERLLTALASGWADSAPLAAGWEQHPAALTCRGELTQILADEFGDAPLWALKDPRISILFPLWKHLLEARGVRPVCALALRHPAEVAGSLRARDGMTKEHALAVWLHYTLCAERSTRGQPRVVVAYSDLLADWRSVAGLLCSALAFSWPVSPDAASTQVEAFLSPSLKHHDAAALTENSLLERWVAQVYSAQMAAARGGAMDTDLLDRIYQDWESLARPQAEARDKIVSVLRERSAKEVAQRNHMIADLRQQMGQLHEEHRRLWEDYNRLQGDWRGAQDQLAWVLGSLSWKVTEPLRAIHEKLGRARPANAPNQRVDS